MIDRQTGSRSASDRFSGDLIALLAGRVLQSASALLLLSIGLLGASGVQAHLMPAQRGTLNFVDDGAFMVLSLPAAAFSDVDHDGDGLLSITEFQDGRYAIIADVRRKVRLLDEAGELRPLEGLMLSPAPPHDAPAQPSSHVIIMGRFALDGAEGPYRLEVELYGMIPDEQTLRISASRPADHLKQSVLLTPEHTSEDLFPPSQRMGSGVLRSAYQQ